MTLPQGKKLTQLSVYRLSSALLSLLPWALGLVSANELVCAQAKVSANASQSAALCPARGEGLRLEQDSEVYGHNVLLVSAVGASLSVERNGLKIVCAAPDWRVRMYNKANKYLYETDLSHYDGYMNKTGAIFWGMTFNRIPLKVVGQGTRLGYKVTLFESPSFSPAERKAIGAELLEKAEYWSTEAITVPPQVVSFINRFYCLPTKSGFPLYLLVHTKAGKPLRFALNTTKISRCVLHGNEFVVPGGLKKVSNDQLVVRKPEDEESVQGLLEGLEREIK